MRTNALKMLVVAMGCGLGVGLLVPCTLAQQPPQTMAVLVAKKKIDMGTLIKKPEDYFKRVRRAKVDVPIDAVSDFAKVKNKRVIRTLVEDEVLRARDLLDAQALSPQLPANTVAVTVIDSSTKLTPGFLMPLSRVDVVSTVRKADKDSVSKVL